MSGFSSICACVEESSLVFEHPSNRLLSAAGVAGVIFAPALHRFLHRFHLDEESENRA
jgi:hypothetical protein